MDNGNGIVTTMPVTPTYGNNGGFGGFGGDSWAWILILLLFAGGGWGNGFGGGYANNMLSYDFPWLMNGQQGINANTNNGFQNAMLNDGITSIRDGISGISTQLCGGFAGVNSNIANGFAQAEIANNARQIADMQTAFAGQTAMSQGFNNISSQMASCCCEQRLGIANLGADIAREACADRQAVNEGVRDILANQTASVQKILDKLCDQELQAERRENQNLRSELMYARGQASQIEQTAQILAGQANEIDGVYNRLKNCPVGTVPVYGNQPIFTCPNSGCGCGM